MQVRPCSPCCSECNEILLIHLSPTKNIKITSILKLLKQLRLSKHSSFAEGVYNFIAVNSLTLIRMTKDEKDLAFFKVLLL
jgi:hypothetical protein